MSIFRSENIKIIVLSKEFWTILAVFQTTRLGAKLSKKRARAQAKVGVHRGPIHIFVFFGSSSKKVSSEFLERFLDPSHVFSGKEHA